jgi:hypothetical protein
MSIYKFMKIRSGLERLLPVRIDEIKLEPEERDILFKGRFGMNDIISRIGTEPNQDPSTSQESPHLVWVVRDGRFKERATRPTPATAATYHVVNSAPALHRAQRVENIVGLTAYGAGAVGFVALIVASTIGLASQMPKAPSPAPEHSIQQIDTTQLAPHLQT